MPNSRPQHAARPRGFESREVFDWPKANPALTIGADPGKCGALAGLDVDGCIAWVAQPSDSVAGMAALVREVRWLGRIRLAVLERTQAMPGNGVVAMHTYGRHADA